MAQSKDRTQRTPNELEIVQLMPQDRVGEWTIESKLGQGAFGAVYLVSDKKGKQHALKVENASETVKVLKMEVFVMLELKRIHARHCCDLLDSGKIGNYKYIVMTLLGPSLHDLREMYTNSTKKCFSLACVLSLGIQCVEAIEDLHLAGYLHRDIKPGNYAISKNEPRKIYMLDFGMARRYIDQNGTVKRPRWAAGFRGTVRYAPISCHVSREQSRTDDLETWLYMQIELTKGSLPWKNFEAKDVVGKYKERCRNEAIHELFGSECPSEYEKIMRLIDGWTYYDSPNYLKIIGLLRAAMKNNNLNEFYDWELAQSMGLE